MMIVRQLTLVVVLTLLSLISKGQACLNLDLFGTIFYATEGNLNVNFYYEKSLSRKSSLQVGLSLGRYIREKTFRDSSIFGPALDYERELWGVAVIPEFRYYFKAAEDLELPKGLFISPYGKAFLSWVNKTDFLEGAEETEYGYILGLGLGLGYKFQINKWSFTPFLGLGKGVSSHTDIFEPGGFGLDFVSPDLLIHRIEFLIGYHLNH